MQADELDDKRDWLHDVRAQERDVQYQAGRRRSSVVKTIKIILIVSAICVCGMLVYSLNKGQNDYAVDLASVEQTPSTENVDVKTQGSLFGGNSSDTQENTKGEVAMIKAKYGGLDDKKQPYTITADKASRSSDAADVINLRKPMADILLNDGSWIATHGAQGMYMQEHMQLFLSDKVKLFHDDGYELETDNLHIDLKTSVMRSKSSVFAHGPVGEIKAEGIEFNPTEDKITFKGPARMKLLTRPEATPAEEKARKE